ncbi:MAG: hypothetical protein FWH29_03385 [Methanobrevibacter sp.]|nr:hypothetical protein [Methanobrevibacter sp.]
MNKKILIVVLVVIAIAIVGSLALVGLNGDDFSENMQEVGAINGEANALSIKIDNSLNDQSKKGVDEKINWTTQLIPLLEKMDDSFNKALNSTDNETVEKYLKLAIKLNQLELNETKNQQTIFKAIQDYNDKKISASEYNDKHAEYMKNYDNYLENTKKITEEINELLKDKPDFVEELKSYGFGGGLYLGEYLQL